MCSANDHSVSNEYGSLIVTPEAVTVARCN